ncbi:MAG: 3-oxoacyl-ACP reductase family protein [Desulfobacterales bacterium]|jgi:NAD(P)-dependent dehydrogenase (short-subunit alcohol dehydrogenase family)|nr:3-oxoacyl-ACP reductase family protein [Desulfobacterales bacterium]
MKRLKNRVAIVTGCAGGIGQSFCVGMAKEGAKVVATDLLSTDETVEKVKSAGGDILALQVDVTSEDSTLKMARQVMNHFGRIDILVNNAGIYPVSPFQDIRFENWKKVTSVNLDGVFLCTKAVYPHMMAQNYGRIVNISSVSVFLGSPSLTPYVTTKAGIIGFTRALASEAGEYGITVNAIAPGLTATKTMLEGSLGAILDKTIKMQALKRRLEPDDLLGALLFLVTDGGDFVTGQTLAVDGGLTRH